MYLLPKALAPRANPPSLSPLAGTGHLPDPHCVGAGDPGLWQWAEHSGPQSPTPSPHGRGHKAGFASTVSERRSQELTLSTNQSPRWREWGPLGPKQSVHRGRRRENLCYSIFKNKGHWALLQGCASLRDSAAECQGQLQAWKERTHQKTLPCLEGGWQKEIRTTNHLWEAGVGTGAAHMAASPTKDSTGRSRTTTPNWHSCGSSGLSQGPTLGARPIPGMVDNGEGKSKLGRVDQCWTQTQWLYQFQMRLKVPRQHQGPQARKRDSCPQGSASAAVANGHRPANSRLVESDMKTQRMVWTKVLIPESPRLFLGCGSQRNSISDTEWRTEAGPKAVAATVSQQQRSCLLQ